MQTIQGAPFPETRNHRADPARTALLAYDSVGFRAALDADV